MNQHSLSKIQRWSAKQIIRRSYGFCTVTHALGNAIKDLGLCEKFEVIGNMVDTRRFHVGPPADLSVPVFLHVSCFEDKSKNISGILDALSILETEKFECKFLLVGEGLDWQFIRQKLLTLRFQYIQVELPGLVIGEALVKLYQGCTAFVLFSNYETQGVVLLEAMACGKPAVATRAGGIPEIITDDKGILVNPGNTAELATAIKEIVTFPNNPVALHQYVKEHFSMDAVRAKLEAFYTNALN